MKASGKLANRSLFASVIIIIFLLVIGGVTQRMLTNQKRISAAEERRYQSRLLADELRQSSDDLTRLARTYVVTADKRYEDQYWEVLDIRNGKRHGRPITTGSTGISWPPTGSSRGPTDRRCPFSN